MAKIWERKIKLNLKDKEMKSTNGDFNLKV
jgi:hypothetical protein